ncbi:MAG: spermidine/putrescine ABC transporter substrate-binding protein [Microbacteriaceae bacterium]|nr:spermidine/putrescine ABC transporter substrate-binding protein [Microbacteriaceae bacterium]
MNQNLPEDPELREIVKSALARKVTRRAVLGGAMATGAAAVLAACAPGGKTELTPAKDVSDSDKTLIWSNWSLYIDVDDAGNYPTLESFQSESGITVTYREDFDDNDSYYGKVKDQLALGQDIGADLTCPTSWMAARWINQGYVQTFDEAELPNKVNLQPAYLGASYDPDRTKSLPYQGILAGFAFDKKAYKDATGKDAPSVVADLWDPALKGRVGVLSEMRDTVGIVAMDLGTAIGDASSLTEDAFMNAIDVIAAKVSDGQISRIKGNSYTQDLANGDTILAIGWSGDIMILNAEAGYDRFGFVLPESGGTISADCFVIPMGATHKKNAEKLMNFYYDPYIAAVLAAYVNYITPVVGAKEEAMKLDPTLAENQLIFPSEEFLAQTQAFRALEDKEEQKFSKAFQEIKLGSA